MADFDGDGKDDLLGFASYRVVVCLQVSSGFTVVEPDEIPFNNGTNCPKCLTYVDSDYWTIGGWIFRSFVGTFLDWDGDGDVDVLRKNLGDQALAGRCFKVRENKNFNHKGIHLLKTVLDSFGAL